MKKIIVIICAIICSTEVFADNPPDNISLAISEKDGKIEFVALYFEEDYASKSSDEIHKNIGKMMMSVIDRALQKSSSVSTQINDGKLSKSVMGKRLSVEVNSAFVEDSLSNIKLLIELKGKSID